MWKRVAYFSYYNIFINMILIYVMPRKRSNMRAWNVFLCIFLLITYITVQIYSANE